MSEETPPPEADETSAELPPEQEERIVDKVIAAVKGVLTQPKEVVDDEPVVEEKVTKEPTTVKEIETDMEAQVREALKKIGAEEEHQKQHETLKKEAERPPVQVGRVTRALWGGGEQ